MRLSRRKIIVGLAVLAVLAAGCLGFREWLYLARLPSPIADRMPPHWRIPFGLDPQVRAAIDGLYSPKAGERAKAAQTLGLAGAPEAVPFLAALLADDYNAFSGAQSATQVTRPPSLSAKARESLAGSGPPERGSLRQWLLGLLSEESDDLTASPGNDTCEALADIGEAARPAFYAALRDPMPLVRERAVVWLGIGDPDRCLDKLVEALGDESAYVRIAAAWALGLSVDARATEALTAVLNNEDEIPDVKEAAREAQAMFAATRAQRQEASP